MKAEVQLLRFEGDDDNAIPNFTIEITPESEQEHLLLGSLEQHPFNAIMTQNDEGHPVLHVFDLGKVR
jgi:hypothetical protein